MEPPPSALCPLLHQGVGGDVRPALPAGGRHPTEPGGRDHGHEQEDRAAGLPAEQSQAAAVRTSVTSRLRRVGVCLKVCLCWQEQGRLAGQRAQHVHPTVPSGQQVSSE